MPRYARLSHFSAQPPREHFLFPGVWRQWRDVFRPSRAPAGPMDCGAGASLDLPIFRSRLPFPNIREMVTSRFCAFQIRFGQRFLYKWYALQDEVFNKSFFNDPKETNMRSKTLRTLGAIAAVTGLLSFGAAHAQEGGDVCASGYVGAFAFGHGIG